ncbi:phosphoribosylglycinamide formyltransferase [Sulfurimonas aquatica]|uniref:phosphoribosylglycinamide formyltransferase 1 n=1 Tax=Sulfurimonas aquatica TaxID=2672570 RepID=A0A975B2M3_9BACT|nr:formyltransferase family protein [Sulfurimonas aquatica]QSZ43049.1 phosphoribosylglycinamide formyltransferase [Sulfurimonas aquatica]
MENIAILASYNGSSFDSIYDAVQAKQLDLNIPLIITNNTNANVLNKARERNVDAFVINSKNVEDVDKEISQLLKKYNCKYVFLAGYMKKINPSITQNFTVLNSHPSLLPQYGGKGMYGSLVHQAVIKNAEPKSGVTLHEVNEEYDEGKIILQEELIIQEGETAEGLEIKIKELEKKVVVKGLKLLTSS